MLPKARLADGRVVQVEGVTFGTVHQIGSPSVVFEHFGPWLPQRLRPWLAPKRPQSSIVLEQPALVVWLTAIDPNTGKHVDLQDMRVDLVDKHGDLLESDRHWFGGQSFWREGQIFSSFPREERKLTLQITPWRTNKICRMEISNPCIARPAEWSGNPLPQQKRIGDLEIILAALEIGTNGGPYKSGEIPARYWQPVWELRHDGAPIAGWEPPDWVAEDATGNRGQYLGVRQPVLRFSATVYASA